ncbi:MAG: DNA polymerase IV [Thermoplasmata archaeon]
MSERTNAPRTLWPEASVPIARPEESRRWILYVDLDAYYVSCELRDRPELVGRPVIVGPPPSDRPSRGVVLSASYEARKFGVHSAMPARTAAARCPEATWIAPDFAKYGRISEEVRALLAEHAPQVVPFSIDEAALSIEAPSPEAARSVAERVQQDLRARLGLPASIGVATTRVVAKIATDRAKPGGIVVVPPDRVAEFVAPLPVRAIPGVGPKTESILKAHGIETIGALAERSPSEVGRWLGSFGREMISLARGEPPDAPPVASGPRSRSTDRTFEADVGSWEAIERTVIELSSGLAAALDREGIRYGAVGVAFRWADFARSQRVRALSAAQEGNAPLADRALHLARELWEAERAGRGRAVRTVSVRTERLSDRLQRQASLDDFPATPP